MLKEFCSKHAWSHTLQHGGVTTRQFVKKKSYFSRCFIGITEIHFIDKLENNECKRVSVEFKHKRKLIRRRDLIDTRWNVCFRYPLAKQPPALMSHLSSHVVVFIGLILQICSCILSSLNSSNACVYVHRCFYAWITFVVILLPLLTAEIFSM